MQNSERIMNKRYLIYLENEQKSFLRNILFHPRTHIVSGTGEWAGASHTVSVDSYTCGGIITWDDRVATELVLHQ